MLGRRAIRFAVMSLALLALLIFTGTFGGLWHHHTESSNSSCSVCHLNHESLEHLPQGRCAPVLVSVVAAIEPQEPRFTHTVELPPLPARAPPAA